MDHSHWHSFYISINKTKNPALPWMFPFPQLLLHFFTYLGNKTGNMVSKSFSSILYSFCTVLGSTTPHLTMTGFLSKTTEISVLSKPAVNPPSLSYYSSQQHLACFTAPLILRTFFSLQNITLQAFLRLPCLTLFHIFWWLPSLWSAFACKNSVPRTSHVLFLFSLYPAHRWAHLVPWLSILS